MGAAKMINEILEEKNPFAPFDEFRIEVSALKEQLTEMRIHLNLVMQTVSLLAEAETFRVRKFNDKLKPMA